ncbi:MAG: hypothetical protein M0P39_12995 [Rhodocyclaceae bacterium]|nr:hypothetical protein [Rhodocyclaceae bacterium]
MTPSIELRIQTMMKAMTEVILPAIESGNDLAREQGQLMIAHLGLLARHWDKALAYDTLCLGELIRLAKRLCDEASGGPRTTAAAAALRELLHSHAPDGAVPATQARINEVRVALAAGIDHLVRATEVDSSAAFHAGSAKAILDHAALQAWRDRVWFADAGMDPERAGLPSIEAMLTGAG